MIEPRGGTSGHRILLQRVALKENYNTLPQASVSTKKSAARCTAFCSALLPNHAHAHKKGDRHDSLSNM